MTSRDDGQTPLPTAISLAEVLRGLFRHKLLIASGFLISFGGSLAYVNYAKPQYATEAQILIQNMETPFDRVQPGEQQRSDAGVDDRVVASQIAVLESTDLGRRVVDALALKDKPEFNSLLKGMSLTSRVALALGFGEDPRLKTPEQRALDRYKRELTVYQQPNSNVITVKFTSIDPKTAAAVTNALTETYIAWTRESQAQPTERARDWLAAQIEELRTKLARSEELAEKFRADAGLLQGATTTLGTQQISELNTQITLAQAASSEARARAETIRDLLDSKGSVDSSADVLASTVVQRLKEQRSDAVRRVAELSATYLPNHPKMIAAQGELNSIDRQIRAEALKVVASLDDQARVAETREKSLRTSLDRLKATEATANIDDVKLKALERDAAADRALLETMLSRFAEASTRQDQAAQPGMARIIQSAAVPSVPSFPKRGPTVLLFTLAGTVLGLGLAFLMELTAAAGRLVQNGGSERRPDQSDASVSMPSSTAAASPVSPVDRMAVDLAVRLAAAPLSPPIGSEARAGFASPTPDFLSADGRPALAAMLDWVAAQGSVGAHARVVVVGADIAQLATASAALGLARGFAAQGRRSVVLDIAAAPSCIEDIAGVANGPGLSDLLSGATDFTKVIGRDATSTVHVFRHGTDWSPQAEALIWSRLETVIAALSGVYDMVVINLGTADVRHRAVSLVADRALLLSPAADTKVSAEQRQALQAAGVATVEVRVAMPAEFTRKSA